MLEKLHLHFDDCRGRSYDNGIIMKDRDKGVQARQLEKYPRSSYVPCGAHPLNLVMAATVSVETVSYFVNVQTLDSFLSAAQQRWSILKDHVIVTLKSGNETRWEGRVNSTEAVRHLAPNVREALFGSQRKPQVPDQG